MAAAVAAGLRSAGVSSKFQIVPQGFYVFFVQTGKDVTETHALTLHSSRIAGIFFTSLIRLASHPLNAFSFFLLGLNN